MKENYNYIRKIAEQLRDHFFVDDSYDKFEGKFDEMPDIVVEEGSFITSLDIGDEEIANTEDFYESEEFLDAVKERITLLSDYYKELKKAVNKITLESIKEDEEE